MNLNDAKDAAAVIGIIFGLIAIFWAVYEHHTKLKLERAKWLASLYEKFYEKSDLKEIRNTLDCDDDVTLEITRLIREQSAKFTDYLNFFEFVAFLSKSGQLNYGEIDDLFGYYLDCLARRPGIRDYIRSNGYELLDNLLNKASGKRK